MSSDRQHDWQSLLNRTSQENDAIRAGYKAYYDEQVAEGSDRVASTFEEFLADLSGSFVLVAEPATKDQIDRLCEIADREVPSSLRSFYANIGGFSGEFGEGTLTSLFLPPENLIQKFAADTRRHEKLAGIGLHDILQLSWSNDKRSLKPEGGFEQAAIDAVNQYLCFGWFGDGFCEAFAYIIETSPNKFGAYVWHQDNALPDPADVRGYDLDELFTKAFQIFDQEMNDEDGEFDIELLGKKLNAS